tara:strand:+ start:95596 stop:96519 length:924 start_codon:yes stop_codon:yes gene_type:complete
MRFLITRAIRPRDILANQKRTFMLKLMLNGPLLVFGIFTQPIISQELRESDNNATETIIIERNNIDPTPKNEAVEDFDPRVSDQLTNFQAQSTSNFSQSPIPANTVHEKRGYISDEYYVPVRSVPNQNGKVTHNGLKSGTPLTITDSDGQWKRILTDFGQQGWIEKRFISESPISRTLLIEEREAKKILEQMLKEEQMISNKLKDALAQKNNEYNSLVISHENEKNTIAGTNNNIPKSVIDENIEQLVKRNHLLIQENDVLTAQLQVSQQNEGQQFFLYGAISVFLGALLAALIPKIRGRRRLSTWK